MLGPAEAFQQLVHFVQGLPTKVKDHKSAAHLKGFASKKVSCYRCNELHHKSAMQCNLSRFCCFWTGDCCSALASIAQCSSDVTLHQNNLLGLLTVPDANCRLPAKQTWRLQQDGYGLPCTQTRTTHLQHRKQPGASTIFWTCLRKRVLCKLASCMLGILVLGLVKVAFLCEHAEDRCELIIWIKFPGFLAVMITYFHEHLQKVIACSISRMLILTPIQIWQPC